MSDLKRGKTDRRCIFRAVMAWFVCAMLLTVIGSVLISSGRVGESGMIVMVSVICVVSSAVLGYNIGGGGIKRYAVIWLISSVTLLSAGALVCRGEMYTGYIADILISNAAGCFIGVIILGGNSYKTNYRRRKPR